MNSIPSIHAAEKVVYFKAVEINTDTLALNILTSHTPLYRVEDFYAEQDLALLFREPVQANDLNDDALGRALDKLDAAEPWKVYSTLAFQALRVLHLPVRLIHGDTTSVSLQGVYEREADLKVTQTNLAWIQEQGLPFVSRLPDTFALGEAVKQTA